MKNTYIYILLTAVVVLPSCKNNKTETVEPTVKPDTEAVLIDTKTTMILEQMKAINELFTGRFIVYNAENKKLKDIEIDSLGHISHSSIYKLISIFPAADKNLVLLSKEKTVNAAGTDTFDYETKNLHIYLYAVDHGKDGSHQRRELVYRLEKDTLN